MVSALSSSPSLSLESTGSTPSLESPSRDSLSLIFGFIEALPSLMGQGAETLVTVGVVVLVVSVAPVELVATPDEINGSSSAYNPTYEYTHYTSICINYRMYSIRTYVYQVYILQYIHAVSYTHLTLPTKA